MSSGYRLNPAFAAVEAPPIPEVHGWVADIAFPPDRPLIDLAQAVPGYPPAEELTRHLAALLREPASHRYTDILGLPALREALAADLSRQYTASIAAGQCGITAGCNQAFCLALMALAAPGDEVILPLPYYFNHQMWLDMLGIRAVHLPFAADAGGVPDPAAARRAIGPRTRALVLVTPNNPTGAIIPPEVLATFDALAREHGIALILDETYKDFLPDPGPPHALFAAPDWPETLVQLTSFSKAYALTGYRVGALVAGARLLEAVTKAMDCVAICAPRLGQEAALFGLTELGAWRAGKARLMNARAAAFRTQFPAGSPYRLVSIGAYFAYLAHPFAGRPAAEVAQGLARRHGLLCLPGSMFGPGQEGFLRFAFANVPEDAMPAIAARLADSLADPALAA